MDPQEIKNRIIQKAQEEKERKNVLQKEFEDKNRKQKNIQTEQFREARKFLSEILNDLPIRKDVKITMSDTSLTIYKSSIGGGSDTYTYFFNVSLGKLCLFHKNKYGMYFDDFGDTSYDLYDHSKNQSSEEIHFDNLPEFLENFEKKIQEFVVA